MKARFLFAVCALAAMNSTHPANAEPVARRVNNTSPRFNVGADDVAFHMDYTAWRRSPPDAPGERIFVGAITPKLLDMVDRAQHTIIMSVFLFDSFYAQETPENDIVGELTASFVGKRRANPEMRIAVILDPSHKAYGRRLSPAEKVFRENGIDVFYSDLLGGLKKASLVGVRETTGHLNRALDTVTLHTWGHFWSGIFSRARVPASFDGDPVTLETVYNASLLKANHRKILFADDGHGNYEALVSSANPHNASAFHINTAVSLRGAPAHFIYNVLREDMRKSASLGTRYAHWHFAADRSYRRHFFEDRFPLLAIETGPVAGDPNLPTVGVQVVTELGITQTVINMLRQVREGDEIRIQMFYLSYKPVIDALLDAAAASRKPVRLLLDANKDSFNKEKDGTPNRQVARYLLREAQKSGGDIRVRWYSTHGEQNHAKIMTIANSQTLKALLTTGSCNWTGRNMAGVNMESNVVLDGSQAAVRAFNRLFDLFWTNADGNEYSLDYEAFADDTGPDWKWSRGERPFYYSTF